MALVSLLDAKEHLNIETAADDDELQDFIDRATDALEAYVGRKFAQATVTAEAHSGDGSDTVVLRYIPVVSITTVTEDGATLAASAYTVDTDTGILYRRASTYIAGSWSVGLRNIAVTYSAGYATPPPRAVQACLELIRHLWDTQRVDRAAGRRPAGSDDYTPGLSFSLPRRVTELVEDLRAPGIA